VIRASVVCLSAALFLTFGAGPSLAAFPGKPGPIAYSKVTYEPETGVGVGGLFTHGPRIKQRPRQLTADTSDHSPSYSADGRWIVFVSDNDERRDSIYVMRSDSSDRREVTLDGLGGADPAFFPSGKAIVFSRSVEGRSHIFSVRLDGSGLRQLTSGPFDDSDPVVSPNGKLVAFTRHNRGRKIPEDRGSNIHVVRPDGSHIRTLVGDWRRDYSEPDWAPDGRRLVYVAGGGSSSDLVVARSDGSRLLRLTPCEGIRCRDFSHPAFSPDGKHIVALSKSNRSSGIEVFRSDGRGSYRSFDDAGFGEEGEGSYLGVPTWGPRPR
jgi:Tol biopolymer transport system component